MSGERSTAVGDMLEARVRVPATAANLGPGFDSFGLAIGRYDDLRAHLTDGPVSVTVSGVGAADVPRDGSHLVLRAAGRVFDELGIPMPGIALTCVNRIPHGSGQGSSAAATVAGMLLARALVAADQLSDADILRLATEMEGHPDNVAPVLYGGLTVSYLRTDGTVGCVRHQVHPGIRLVVFTADQHSSTHETRGMLPALVPHADAAANAAAAAVLLYALTEDPSYLMDGTEDRLHQRYRAAAMPASYDLVGQLRAAGVAAVISGAGPSVLALVDRPFELSAWQPAGFSAAELAVDRSGAVTLLTTHTAELRHKL